LTEPAAEGVTFVGEAIPLSLLREMAATGFGDMVKAVVDVERRVMAVGGDLHADEEAVLLDHGSLQGDIWGLNLYPDHFGEDDWIEYDSMINIRPRQGNRSRLVEDPILQRAIVEIVSDLVIGDD
jgi:hypothetical protein